mmetsp:Transcript_106453/g.168076  ORF Transcript_106453/g.168076 Transcript_106453/m.168076 type:complete len:215 (+) Transcript_106453:1401-2045(+)
MVLGTHQIQIVDNGIGNIVTQSCLTQASSNLSQVLRICAKNRAKNTFETRIQNHLCVLFLVNASILTVLLEDLLTFAARDSCNAILGCDALKALICNTIIRVWIEQVERVVQHVRFVRHVFSFHLLHDLIECLLHPINGCTELRNVLLELRTKANLPLSDLQQRWACRFEHRLKEFVDLRNLPFDKVTDFSHCLRFHLSNCHGCTIFSLLKNVH